MHIPVLLKETLELLNPKGDEIIVDATINGGGHTEAILNIENFKGAVIGIDQDKNLVSLLEDKLKNYIKNGRLKLICGNFRNIDEHLNSINIKKIHGAIFDLGMSSSQLINSERGFSFLRDEPLNMSYKAELAPNDLTAEKIINDWTEKEIIRILKEYGEERFVNRIAKNIVEIRKKKRIKTTFELIEIIKKSIPFVARKRTKIHPATKTFMALRIAVNDELNALKHGLTKSFDCLKQNGRITVISFHSLEDRIVKNFFKNLKNQNLAEILTKKPIIPKEEEIKTNPRSRSAKLRTIKKTV